MAAREQGNSLPLITALTALGSVSVSIYLPALPVLAAELKAPAALVQLSLTLFLFVFALSQLAYGPLADRFGRKPPILCGLGIYVAGSIACALAGNAYTLIAARVVQALGAAAGPALGRAVLRDLYTGPRLASSLAAVAAAVALSPMLGPVAGGYIQVLFGWRYCFAVLAIAGAGLAAATWFSLPETNPHASADGLRPAVILHNYGTLLRDREYVSALLCGGLLTAGNFAWTAGAPFVFARTYGFTPDRYGNIALVVGAGYVLGTIASGRLSKVLTAPVLVYSGMSLVLAGALALNAAGVRQMNYGWAAGAMILFTAGMGVVIPMSAACALSRHPEMAGAAAGLLGALQILTGTLGTVAVSLFRSSNFGPTAVILAVTGVLALLAAWVALQPFRDRVVPQGAQG
jgi:DHA1 family bicyclomycin/chloramphenicol resistance-like MFS transporter